MKKSNWDDMDLVKAGMTSPDAPMSVSSEDEESTGATQIAPVPATTY